MKAESNPSDSWEKLAAARRAALAAAPPADDGAAPFGFAQRVSSLALERQRHRRLAWWTRWSLQAAGAATLAAALMALARAPEVSTPLLAAPALEIPSFSSL